MKCPFSQKGCGGCHNIDTMYGVLLKQKNDRFHAFFPDAEKIVGAQEPTRYRNKVLRTFAQGRESLYAGIYREGTHQVISVRDCLLENKRADEIAQTALDILAAMHVPAYREDFHKGVVRHLQVRRAPTSGQAVVTVVTGTKAFAEGTEFAKRLMQKCPEVRGVTQSFNDRATSAVMGYTSTLLGGRDEIWDDMCGLHVCLSSRTFYQVNTAQAEKLYTKAIELAGLTESDTVLDAYCGVGMIGMLAAKKAGHVTGIELVKPSVDCARAAARVNKLQNIDFVVGDAAAALKNNTFTPNVILMDPPRAGCDPRFLEAVSASTADRIVYISCNPETLKRDIGILRLAGWTLQSVHPFDLFPYTEHIETVVLLSKGEISTKISE